MKDWTNEEIEMLKKLGGLFVPVEKAATILQVHPDELAEDLQDPLSESYKAYFGAMYLAEVEVRESVINLAKAGSSPAQTMALDFITECSAENLEYGINRQGWEKDA